MIPKATFYMLYSHNTLKKISVQNRKEETAINSPREISLNYLCLPREPHDVKQKHLGGEVWELSTYVILCVI